MRNTKLNRKLAAMLAAVLLLGIFPLNALANGIFGEAQVAIVAADAGDGPEIFITVDGENTDLDWQWDDDDDIWLATLQSPQLSVTELEVPETPEGNAWWFTTEDGRVGIWEPWMEAGLVFYFEGGWGSGSPLLATLKNDGTGANVGLADWFMILRSGDESVARINIEITEPVFEVTEVTVAPETADVQQGTSRQFAAEIEGAFPDTGAGRAPFDISGTGAPGQVGIEWSLRAPNGDALDRDDLLINALGVLTVNDDAALSPPPVHVRATTVPETLLLSLGRLYVNMEPAGDTRSTYSIALWGEGELGDLRVAAPDGELHVNHQVYFEGGVDSWDIHAGIVDWCDDADEPLEVPRLDIQFRPIAPGGIPNWDAIPDTFSGEFTLPVVRGAEWVPCECCGDDGKWVGGVTATLTIVVDW